MKKKCFFYFFVEHALPRAAGDKILQNTLFPKLRETKFYRTRSSPSCGRQNSTEHDLPQAAGDKILQNTTFPKLWETKFYRTRLPQVAGENFLRIDVRGGCVTKYFFEFTLFCLFDIPK